MVKKMVATAIIVIMLCSGGIQTYAQAVNVLPTPSNISYEMSILSQLGIINANEIDDVSTTRGAFAKIIVNMLATDIISNNVVTYSDVSNTHSQYSYIQTVSRLKLMRGSDGQFKADAPITCTQAIKVMVSLLGFEYEAMLKGDYPIGYLSAASDLGITKGVAVNGEQPITKDNLIKLIYNTCMAPISIPLSFNNEQIEYTVSKSETFLKIKRNIIKVSGIVTGNNNTLLTSPNTTFMIDYCRIGSESYVDKSLLSQQFLGKTVDAYLYTKNEPYEIVAIGELKNKNNTVVIDAKNIVEYNNNSNADILKYYDETEVVKQLKFSKRSINVIYNGIAIRIPEISDLQPAEGFLTFIDNNSDDIFDVVFVWEYLDYILDVESDTYITDKNGKQTIKIDYFDVDKKINIYNDGVSVNLKEIKKGSLLSVFSSKIENEKQIITIYASTRKIEGVIQEISLDNRTIVVDDATYNLTAEVANKFAAISKVGAYGFLRMNFFDKIVDFSESEDADEAYGYLVKIIETGGLDEKLQCKIYTTGGNMKSYYIDKKVKVDGFSYGTLQKVIKAIETNGVIEQLIKYNTNTDGEVNYIDTAKTTVYETERNLTKTIELNTPTRFNGTARSFEAKAIMSPEVIVFRIPNDLTQEKYFMIDTPAFATNERYSFVGYDGGDTNEIQVAVMYIDVIDSTPVLENTASTMLVERATTFLTEDGENVLKLYGYVNNSFTSIMAKDSETGQNLNIGSGDIVRYSLINTDVFDKIVKSMNKGAVEGNSAEVTAETPLFGAYFGGISYAAAICYVADYTSNAIALYTDDTYTTKNIFSLHHLRSVLKYKAEGNIITVASLNDLMPHKHMEDVPTKVYVKLVESSIRDIYILE